MKWTPEETAACFAAAGTLTANELADAVDRPAYVVHRYCQRQGIVLKRAAAVRELKAPPVARTAPVSGWTDERVASLRKLWVDEGLSAAQISKHLGGVSRNGVLGKLARLGLSGTEKSRSAAVARAPIRLAPSAPGRAPPGPGSSIYQGDPRKSPLQKKLDTVVANETARAADLALPAEPSNTGNVVPMLQLGAHSCRWPIGTPGAPGFGFCGEDQSAGRPYCAPHSRRAFVAVSDAVRKRSNNQALYLARRAR